MGFPSNLQGQGGTVTLRVVVRTAGLDTFIQKYSRFVKDDRIFIFTKSSQPIGTRVRFTLELIDGTALLSGEGTVTRLRGETGDPSKPPGMELRFHPIDEPSRRIVEFMLAERETPPATKQSRPAPSTVPAPLPPRPSLSTPSTTTRSFFQKTPIEAVPPAAPPSMPPPATSPVQIVSARAEASAFEAMAPTALDDSLQNFPTVDAPPAYVESFRPERSSGLVPANPFSEVSDGAIEYFVEWSLERSTAPPGEEPTQASFGNIQMARPSVEMEVAAPLGRIPLRLPSLLFGLGLGVILGGAGHLVWSRRSPPSATVLQNGEGMGASPASMPGPPPGPKGSLRPVPPGDGPGDAPGQPAAALPPPVHAATAPRAGSAELAITSRPPGAAVRIDDQEAGHTPLKTQVAAGRHQVELTLDRYANASQSVQAPGAIDVVMKRPHATLTIESNPVGAEVFIGGERRGRAPVTIGLPAFENYDVQVQLAGGKSWRRRVYLKAPAIKVLAQLSPPPKTTPYLQPKGRTTGIR